jgi:hypothetical protein
MSDWISAKEASGRAREAFLTNDDLIEWARRGQLRSRAQSGAFSHFDITKEISFNNGKFGNWPDIPADFWCDISKSLWGAGTFAATVSWLAEPQNTHDKYEEHEHIILYGVTFNEVDLTQLLNGLPPLDVAVQPQKERWQQQRITEQQRAAFEFLEKLRTHPPKTPPSGPIGRHKSYVKWAKNNNLKPLGRSAFTKWAGRYADGWRLEDNKLVYAQ